jgi:four helix bundle protein
MQNFKKLGTYQKSYDLSREVTNEMKEWKNYRLKGQLFGAITSIPAHLAELAAYDSDKEKMIRLRRSIGEANEAEYWLNFCKDTGELPAHKSDVFVEKLVEIRKMLHGLIKAINKNNA